MVKELKVCRNIIIVSLSLFFLGVLFVAMISDIMDEDGPSNKGNFTIFDSSITDSQINFFYFSLLFILISLIMAPILMLIGMTILSLKVERTRYQTSTIIGTMMWSILLFVGLILFISVSHLNTIPASLLFVSLMLWGHIAIILPLYRSMSKIAFFIVLLLIILPIAISFYAIYNNQTDEFAAKSLAIASSVILIFQINFYISQIKKIEKDINKPEKVHPILDHQ